MYVCFVAQHTEKNYSDTGVKQESKCNARGQGEVKYKRSSG